jgi:uncharacterized protein with FMN-binding domain
VLFLKKLLALTISAALVLSSVVLAAGSTPVKQVGVDAISAATDAEPTPKPTATPAPTAKPTPEPVKKTVYQDGVYVTYGNAYTKGTEGAKVTIKDGKIADIELMRTSPKLIDRDARSNYKGLWNAYGYMKKRFLGKTMEQAAKVDTVTGATRSSEGWKLSVARAFTRALTDKTADQVYFEGVHMGIDPQGKYMVFSTYDKTKLTAVDVYPLTAAGDAIEDATMTDAQKASTAALAAELLKNGLKAQPVKGYESEATAVLNAFIDAEKNAKIVNDVKHIDGFYSAYGAARDKGVERADVYIRNDKLVDVKLYRLGSNLLDRGATAYASVVTANAPMVAKLLEKGSYIENYDSKVDAITGATESSHSWNEAVERAFEKAAIVPPAHEYFEGTFAGVDSQSKILVLVDIKADKVTKVASYLMSADQKLISTTAYTSAQKAWVATINAGLLKDGSKMKQIFSNKVLSTAAKAAFTDALENASTKQNNYKDGTFTANSGAYDKGTQQAVVTLRNGKIVGLKLYRLGVNMVDRGASAYPAVVNAIPELLKKYMAAATRENAQKVDAITGATGSSNGLKAAVELAFQKAEIIESNKVAYSNGVYGGVDTAKSVYVLVTVKRNLPNKVTVYYLDSAGKVRPNDSLFSDEQFVKTEFEKPSTEQLHKYAYRPTPFGTTESQKAVSAKVIEAMKAALEAAGR